MVATGTFSSAASATSRVGVRELHPEVRLGITILIRHLLLRLFGAKGGLDPLRSSDHRKVGAPPPLPPGGGAASCRRLRVLINLVYNVSI